MKTTMKTGLAALVLLLAISCKKETVSTAPSTSINTEDNAAIVTGPHRIGDHFGGGVIFWIDSTGEHGLIADTVNLGRTTWWNGSYITTGATGTNIGKGYANTIKIVSAQGKGNYAAYMCASYTGSGYTDWFLPSIFELYEFYKLTGGHVKGGYWSSTEYSNSQARGWSFSVGNSFNTYKGSIDKVLPVRAF